MSDSAHHDVIREREPEDGPAGSGPGPADCVVIVTQRLGSTQGINGLLDEDLMVILTRCPRQAVEVLTRPRSPLARPVEAPVTFGDLEIHGLQQRVHWRGRRADLGEREVRLLLHLAGRAGGTCSLAELAAHVWEAEYGVDAPVVHSAVQRPRRKLAEAGIEVRIESVRGYGLRLLARVSDPRTP
ncbi:hypothetical protein GCM10009678_85720 [Actinomadura kijaniata]|uniref:DNA-binding winged helix-turn-helix (WHTH) protein n=1 Tax=Actinomadura namibiensis TaxID=182080 RepID=A0A7W3M0H8_ACTNM|nr:winged helix-turn-helix domain-containing protein [Actinomadura namibiensis]MBA8957681.1 DNA-binding winged helix-turn-helix (wHTH) protein [Actinomadura namibiensis]